ncbi:Zinc finger C-x8-C-x5-C-x3-H type domain containing protein [Babesia divergens]|uniref:Zinc finger C-x8-C-x5-C-x3-H type domain containing protein n=1 Tax=Babesia divergens TaxID=32595 RepID=A0AAD9GG07_BABDI|nr:Zinc finger C-x8-C-x5-C-x3-H type domain containing protein [Babesia divergens]
MTRRSKVTPRDNLNLHDGSAFRLPMSLNEFMEDLICTDSAKQVTRTNDDPASVDTLRQYIEGLKFSDADSTISDILNNVSLSSESSDLQAPSTVTGSVSSSGMQGPRLGISQWSAPFSGFHSMDHPPTLRSRSNPPEDTSPRPESPDKVSPFGFTTYYDSPPDLNVDDLVIRNTPSSDKFTWDVMWRTPALQRYIRPSGPKIQRFPPSFLSESLRAIKDEVVKAEKALACMANDSAYLAPMKPASSYRMDMKASKPLPTTHGDPLTQSLHRNTSLCRYWQRGSCTKADCNFAHGVNELVSTVGIWKTTICHHWKKGNCRVGSNCRHAHGEEERQPTIIPSSISSKRTLNFILKQEKLNSKNAGCQSAEFVGSENPQNNTDSRPCGTGRPESPTTPCEGF